jgi:hypothetical protein
VLQSLGEIQEFLVHSPFPMGERSTLSARWKDTLPTGVKQLMDGATVDVRTVIVEKVICLPTSTKDIRNWSERLGCAVSELSVYY